MHRFLKQMGEAAPDEHYWNVSLFHYRNHGADIGSPKRSLVFCCATFCPRTFGGKAERPARGGAGRVLVGMQVPDDQMDEFQGFLKDMEALGYNNMDESGNAIYKHFLR